MTQPSDEAANRPPTGGQFGPPPGPGPFGYGPPPGPPYRPPPPGYWPPPPPPLSPGGVPLADFGTRLLAYLIDGAILTVVALIVAVPAFLIFFFTATPTIDDTDANGNIAPDAIFGFFGGMLLLEAGLVLFILAITYVYAVEMMWRSGQTVGKRIMKLYVVPLDPRLRLTRGMAVKRWAVQYAAGVIFQLFVYLDGLWQLWDKPFLQTLHDKAAQTVVIKVSA